MIKFKAYSLFASESKRVSSPMSVTRGVVQRPGARWRAQKVAVARPALKTKDVEQLGELETGSQDVQWLLYAARA